MCLMKPEIFLINNLTAFILNVLTIFIQDRFIRDKP
jgi:hypothetical protein